MISATSTDLPGLHPAAFDAGAYRLAVETVHGQLGLGPARISAVRSAAARAASHAWVPAPVGAAMLSTAEQITTGADELLDRIVELLEGAAAPMLLFGHASGWINLKAAASDVQARLRPDQLPARTHWKGVAADRYATATGTQSGAAGRVAAAAGAVPVPLAACAIAGLAFYVAVGVILVDVLEGLTAAAVAFGSDVFSWAGVILGLEAVSVGASALIATAATLVALLGTQAQTMNALRSELADHSTFPGGQWPSAVADNYNDATVTDGDAKWSVQP